MIRRATLAFTALLLLGAASAEAGPITLEFEGPLVNGALYAEDGYFVRAVDTGVGPNHLHVENAFSGADLDQELWLHGANNAEHVRIDRSGALFDFEQIQIDVNVPLSGDWRMIASSGAVHVFSGTGLVDLAGTSGWQDLSWLDLRHSASNAPSGVIIEVDDLVLNTVPLPATGWLALGLLGVLWGARRLRRRRSARPGAGL
jgi:hypothetical protein